jgi:site-specific DNA recombinase
VKGFAEEADVRDTLIELKAERRRLEADLASAEKPPETVALHPTALARYKQQVEDLAKALSSENAGDMREPISALRELVAAVVIHPTPPGAPMEIEVRGRLAALIGHDVFPAARMWGDAW